MKFVCTSKKNKRGYYYNTRSTRVANGFSKHYAYKVKKCKNENLALAVYGNFDSLNAQKFDRIWVEVKHPINPEYTKKVMVLKKNRPKYWDRLTDEYRLKIQFKLR
jgi:hypothetical protein